MKKMTRLNVSIKSDLVKQIEAMADKQGKTVSSLISEASNLYVESQRSGLRSEDVIRAIRIIELLREIDAIPVPGLLLESMIKEALKGSSEETLKRWYERGTVIGSIMKRHARNLRQFSDFVFEHRLLLPIDLFEMEFDDDEAVTLVLSGVGYSADAARCTSEGLRGLLFSYGYSVDTCDFSEGFVRLTARPEITLST